MSEKKLALRWIFFTSVHAFLHSKLRHCLTCALIAAVLRNLCRPLPNDYYYLISKLPGVTWMSMLFFSSTVMHEVEDYIMRTQKEMVESFQMAHRDYMKNLTNCLDEIEKDFEESREIDEICTGEWCRAIEFSLDEMAKDLYSISEPRWVSDDYSRTLRNMRRRLHDLYAKYQGTKSVTDH